MEETFDTDLGFAYLEYADLEEAFYLGEVWKMNIYHADKKHYSKS